MSSQQETIHEQEPAPETVPMERQDRSTLSPFPAVPLSAGFDRLSLRYEQERINKCVPKPVEGVRNCQCGKFGGVIHTQIKRTCECTSPFPNCFICDARNRSMHFCPNLCFHIEDWKKFTAFLMTKHRESVASAES
jgi:hypothetical protein